MKVAVVGGSGFIGGHVTRRILGAGGTVVNVDRRAPADLGLGVEYLRAELAGDLESENAASSCGPVDAVVWLAAPLRHRTGVDETAREDLAVMVEAPLLFLMHLDPCPASFVYLSSIQVYGAPCGLPVDETHPTEPYLAYGIAKLCAEHTLRVACSTRPTSLAVLRPSFVYGPGQHRNNVIPRFLDALRRGEPPSVYGAGNDIRDDVYVGDVAGAIVAAVELRAKGVFNIASGRPHTLLEVAQAACRVSGRGLRPRHQKVPSDWIDRWFSVDRARRELGFEATTSLEEGIAAMWQAEDDR